MFELALTGKVKKLPPVPNDAGPGPQVLGKYFQSPTNEDLVHGYFGRLATNTGLPTGEELRFLLSITAGTLFNDDTEWFKFYLDGKILYMPVKPITYGVNFNQLAAVGATTGKDITYRGYTFRVRLPKALGAHGTPGQQAGVDASNTQGSEWNRTMYHVTANVFASQQGPNWETLTDDQLGIVSGNNGYQSMCSDAWFNGSFYHQTREGPYFYLGAASASYAPATLGWRPVLELVLPDA